MFKHFRLFIRHQMCYERARLISTESHFNHQNYLDRHATVQIRKAHYKDKPTIINLLRRNFQKFEPIFQNAAFHDPSLNTPSLEAIWESCIDQGLTLMALSGRRRNFSALLGVSLNAKLCAWDAQAFDKLAACIKCPKTKQIVRFHGDIIRQSNIHKQFGVSHVFHVAYIIYDEKLIARYCPNLSNQELVQLLLGHSTKFAKIRGYEVVSLGSMNELMSQVSFNVGMRILWQQPYRKFVHENHNYINKSTPKYIKIFVRIFKE